MWFICCRVKLKKPNLEDTDVAAAVETAVNVERVRKRIKKRRKQRSDPANDDVDVIDGYEETSRTRGEPQDNLGYDKENREDEGVYDEGGKSQARENLGYEGEQETGETSRRPRSEASKTGKKRRRKLKGQV